VQRTEAIPKFREKCWQPQPLRVSRTINRRKDQKSPQSIAVFRSKDRKHEVFGPCSQPIILDYHELNQAVLLNPSLRLFEIHTGSVSDKLGAEIALLITYQVVLINTLAQPSGCGFSATRSQQVPVSSILVVDGVQAVL